MTTPEPPVITVWDNTLARRGWVGDPLAVRLTERHNAVSTAEITVAADHRRLGDLLTPGCRVTVDRDGQRMLSGPVTSWRGAGPARAGSVTLGVEGDLRVLRGVLCWPVPGAGLGAQTVAYDVRTGPAETVLKGFVTANLVGRLGRPVTVAANLARGATVTVQGRFHSIMDRVLPAVEAAGLGVSVVQDDTLGLVLDVYEPVTYQRVLSEASGVVTDWQWSRVGPAATRVIAGDQGQAEARSFTSTVDAARESEWADVIEVFRDARDTDDPATLTQRRAETLADGAPKTGLRLTLSETDNFRYGTAVRVGDRVTVEVGPGVVVTDVLREAVLEWTADEGLRIEPVVGERTDDPDAALAAAVASIARAVREQGRQ